MNRYAAMGLAGLCVLCGAGLVLAGFCVALVPVLGGAGALAVTGLVLLAVAAFAVQAAQKMPRPSTEAQDPLLKLVFDLSFTLGRSLRRRRS